MASIRRCSRCVLSHSFPNVEFDENGLCNYCTRESSDRFNNDTIKAKIANYLDKIRGKYPYDAIVCYSGGKDSTYTLRLAIEKYNLKVLAYTFDNNFLSEFAKTNIDTVTGELGVDHLFFKANSRVFNKFYRFSATEDFYSKKSQTGVSDICQTCVNFINLKAVQIAIQQNIPAIIAGFTLGQIPRNSVMYEFKYSAIQKFRVTQNEKIISKMGDKIQPYLYLNNHETNRDIYPYYLNILAMEYVKEEEIITACKEIGWKEPKDLDGCSSNCQLNSVANFVAIYKNKFHPYEKELSYLIRKGLMTRDEAIVKLKNLGNISATKEIFQKLGYQEEETDKIIDYIQDWSTQ